MRKNFFSFIIFFSCSGALAKEWFLHQHEEGIQKIFFKTADDGWPEIEQVQVFSLGDSEQLQRFSDNAKELRGSSEQVLWVAKHAWDWHWEQRFAEWIQTEVDADFFSKHNIATDCADVAYALRWIFSRIHRLEMASRVGARGEWFTHRSLRDAWRRLPTHEEWHQDRRFRAALDYVLQMTFTHSLQRDSYPVALTWESLLPGRFHLSLFASSGHTQVIARSKHLSPEQQMLPLMILESTVPRLVRSLNARLFTEVYLPTAKESLRGFRWPRFQGSRVQLVEEAKMPDYSQAQFLPPFQGEGEPFYLRLYKHLLPNFDPILLVQEMTQQLVERLRSRVGVVQAGVTQCHQQPMQCAPGSAKYEEWSTPSRDRRIRDLAAELNRLEQAGIYWPNRQTFLESTRIDVSDSKTLSAAYLIDSLVYEIAGSDPRLSLFERWGIADGIVSHLLKLWQNLEPQRESLVKDTKSSEAIDGQFLKYRTGFHKLMQRLSPEQRRDLLGLRDWLQFQEILQLIPWRISSASAKAPHRRGEHRQSERFFDSLFIEQKFEFSDGGYLVQDFWDQRWIVKSQTEVEPILLDWQGWKIFKINPRSKNALVLNKGQDFVWLKTTGEVLAQWSSGQSGLVQQTLRFNEFFLSYAETGQITVLSPTGKQQFPVESMIETVLLGLQEHQGISVLQNKDHFEIWQESQLVLSQERTASAPMIFSGKWQEFLFLQEAGGKSFAVNLKNKGWQVLPGEIVPTVNKSTNLGLLTSAGTFQIVRHLSSKDQYQAVPLEGPIFADLRLSGQVLVALDSQVAGIKNDQLVFFPEAKGKGIVGISSKYGLVFWGQNVISAVQDWRGRVRKISGPPVLSVQEELFLQQNQSNQLVWRRFADETEVAHKDEFLHIY